MSARTRVHCDHHEFRKARTETGLRHPEQIQSSAMISKLDRSCNWDNKNRPAVEDLNGGYRRAALGGDRLSRRRHSCPKDVRGFGADSGVSQTQYSSDFKRTWVRLGERGRRDRLGARRGESLFSPISAPSTTPYNQLGMSRRAAHILGENEMVFPI
jgi:hypothetical protein